MNDVKIAKDCYLPKSEVKLYVAYETNAVKNMVRKLRKENKVFDFTCGRRILSVIFLQSGEVILVNTAIETLYGRMNPKKGAKK